MRQLNKTIKYCVGEQEDIGSVPYGSIITNAKLIFKGDGHDGLVFFPKKIVYEYDGETGTDKGSECLSFGIERKGLWIRSSDDWINLRK